MSSNNTNQYQAGSFISVDDEPTNNTNEGEHETGTIISESLSFGGLGTNQNNNNQNDRTNNITTVPGNNNNHAQTLQNVDSFQTLATPSEAPMMMMRRTVSSTENQVDDPENHQQSGTLKPTSTSATTTTNTAENTSNNNNNNNNNQRRKIGDVFSTDSISMARSELFASHGYLHDEGDDDEQEDEFGNPKPKKAAPTKEDQLRQQQREFNLQQDQLISSINQHQDKAVGGMIMNYSVFQQSIENPLRKPLPFALSGPASHYLQQLMLLDKKKKLFDQQEEKMKANNNNQNQDTFGGGGIMVTGANDDDDDNQQQEEENFTSVTFEFNEPIDNSTIKLSLHDQISTLIQHVPSPSSWLLSDFEVRAAIIGSGALGKVYLCRLKQQPISVEYVNQFGVVNNNNNNDAVKNNNNNRNNSGTTSSGVREEPSELISTADDDHIVKNNSSFGGKSSQQEGDENNNNDVDNHYPRFENGYHSLPNPFFAMKIMKKHELLRLRQTNRVIREARIQQRIACANLRNYYLHFYAALEREQAEHDEEEEEEEGDENDENENGDHYDKNNHSTTSNHDGQHKLKREDSTATSILPMGKRKRTKSTSSVVPPSKQTPQRRRRSKSPSIAGTRMNNQKSTTTTSPRKNTRSTSLLPSNKNKRRSSVAAAAGSTTTPPAVTNSILEKEKEATDSTRNSSRLLPGSTEKEDLDFENNTDGLINLPTKKKTDSNNEHQQENTIGNDDSKQSRAKRRALRRLQQQKQIDFFDSVTSAIAPSIDPAASFFVSLFRTFSDEKRVYFILEHAAGGELFARLKSSQSRFPIDVVRFYAAEIVIALDYLHNKEKTVFRDLQPENILLDGAGHLKLCDFGNAKCLSMQEAQNYEEIIVPHNPSSSSSSSPTGNNKNNKNSKLLSSSLRYSKKLGQDDEAAVDRQTVSSSSAARKRVGGESSLSMLEQVTAEYQRNRFLYNQTKINENRPSPENYVAFASNSNNNNNNNNNNINNNNTHNQYNTVRTFTICGVAEYTAPEVVAPVINNSENKNGGSNSSSKKQSPTTSSPSLQNDNFSSSSIFQGHSFAVDWWSLGIIIFEMLAGYPPFFDDVPNKIFEKAANASRDTIPFPTWFDTRTKDLLIGLLNPDPAKRLGSLKRGVTDIMKHRFFAGIDWAAMRRKQVPPPDMIRESLVKTTVIPNSVMRRAQAQAPASTIPSSLPLNLGSTTTTAGTTTSAAGKKKSSSQSGNNNNNDFVSTTDVNHLHDEQFDPTSMNSLESLRRRDAVSADVADMFLGYPYDKYPETEQTYSNNNNQNDYMSSFGPGGSSRVPGGVSQKPLTDAQQEIFACFG